MDDTKEDWDDLRGRCMASRAAPVSPDEFAKVMREGMEQEKASPGTGINFTNGRNATAVCIPQHKTGFLKLVGNAEKLEYLSLGWGDEEVAVLMYIRPCQGRDGAAQGARAR